MPLNHGEGNSVPLEQTYPLIFPVAYRINPTYRVNPASYLRQDLARVENVLRVKRLLERAHEINGLRTVLKLHELSLVQSDTVLTSTGALSLNRYADNLAVAFF